MKKDDVPTGRAISIKQPFIEEILLGKKKFEYRTFPTNIRGRVFLYASSRPRLDVSWRKAKRAPDDVPLGMIVGSVEIVDCVQFGYRDYGFKLKNPRRYKKLLKPKNHPQPCFFFPFGKTKKSRT